MNASNDRTGFTLIELVLVIVILGIIASVALRSMQPAMESAREQATQQEMRSLAYAIAGNPSLISDGVRTDFGYVGDIGALPPDLNALAANPGGYSTWKGPYISANFAEDPNGYKKDAWGADYAYSGGITISSAGGGSAITEQIAGSVSELTSNSVSGNIFDGLGISPGDSAVRVSITIIYPNGIGDMTSSSVAPNAAGLFAFNGIIPIGNHLIRAVYSPANDTSASYVSVTPGSDNYCEMRFSESLW